MARSSEFTVTYWGITGSYPRTLSAGDLERRLFAAIEALRDAQPAITLAELTATPATLRHHLECCVPFSARSTYGGNTTCIELRTHAATFLVDAGTGLPAWAGACLSAAATPGARDLQSACHLFLTHAHLDHVCGLPFVRALYDHRSNFTIWGSPQVLAQLQELFDAKAKQAALVFPITLAELAGIKAIRPIDSTAPIDIEGTSISALELNHPGGSLGYRFDRSGRSVVVVTDHELSASPDAALARFAHQADLFYLDSQYTLSEYGGDEGVGSDPPQPRHGWGHGTVEGSIATALAAGAKRLHLGHHDPRRSDEQLAKLAQYVRQCLAAQLKDVEKRLTAELAVEGTTWQI